MCASVRCWSSSVADLVWLFCVGVCCNFSHLRGAFGWPGFLLLRRCDRSLPTGRFYLLGDADPFGAADSSTLSLAFTLDHGMGSAMD